MSFDNNALPMNSGEQKQYPLSFPQRRLWFLAQFESDNVAYNTYTLYGLSGELDLEALQRSFAAVVRRHEILRTTFRLVDDEPMQCVRPDVDSGILFMDYSDKEDAEHSATKVLEAQATEVYDLEKSPLFRLAVVKVHDKRYFLQIAMHQIITDDWSIRLFLEELGEYYSACHAGVGPPSKPPPLQYGEFASTQLEQSRDNCLQEQVDFWKEALKGVQPIPLPTDKPRPPQQTFDGDSLHWVISPELTASLHTAAKKHCVTPFTMMLVALNVLLARYSQQNDIVIGIPIANRNRSDLEKVLGFFVNALALRTKIPRGITVEEVVRQTNEASIQAYRHQHLPFEKLVEELQPERDLSRSPIFQVFFAFQNLPETNVRFAGLTLERLRRDRTTVMNDLDLFAWMDEERLRGTFAFNTSLFERDTIKRMADHFCNILETVASRQDIDVWKIPLLREEERRRILVDWNLTDARYDEAATIPDLFERQVARTPEATALATPDSVISYSELNTRSNQLAHRLRGLGVRAGTPVGIYMQRSVEQIAAIIGVMKSGGAYVPLDPEYPRERIRFMLEDSGAPVLVTDIGNKALEEYDGTVVSLDQEFTVIRKQSVDNPERLMTADDPAYVIYTSGSTGASKGVIGIHRGAINRIEWMWNRYPFEDREVCCLKTRIGFVDSVSEIFGSLLQGVPSVLISEQTLLDPGLFIEELSQNRVTRLAVVPSLLCTLLDATDELAERLPYLRMWITSGERLSDELCHRFLSVMPNRVLLNLYGSSEVSAAVTACELTSSDRPRRVSIGRPIANSKAYILDRELRPVPRGMPGELCVSGPGLARGYMNRPDLTADRFVPDPFASDGSSRLFKTGDRARFWSNGEIEFLGREDSQIELRGFRIELSEVEAVVRSIAGVSDAAVVLPTLEAEGLVAFYKTIDGATIEEAMLEKAVKSKLPRCMVPAAFLRLDAFPLSPSGKVDRGTLVEKASRIGRDARQRRQVAVSARERNQAEAMQRMIEIWEGVLNVRKLGADDNFFDYGGHSLLALDLILKVERAFRTKVPVQALFEAQTPREMTARLKYRLRDVVHFTLAPVNPRCLTTPLFLVNGLFLYRDLARQLGTNQPVYGIYIDEEVDPVRTKTSLQTRLPVDSVEFLAERYLGEIRAIQPNGPYQLGGESFGGVVAFEIAHQLAEQGEEVALLVLLDTNAPGTLDKSWSLRFYNHSKNFARDGWPYMRKLGKRARGRTIRMAESMFSTIVQQLGISTKDHARGRVYRTYTPQPLACRIVVFKARHNEWLGVERPDDLGWGEYGEEGVIVHQLDGDHLGILRPPYVQELARKLKTYLVDSIPVDSVQAESSAKSFLD